MYNPGHCVVARIFPTPSGFAGAFLSDAVRAYRHLLDVMNAPRRPGENRSLVVNNSWGMFTTDWDFLSDIQATTATIPTIPLTVSSPRWSEREPTLSLLQAIVAPCPDGRCNGVTTQTIYGANSSPHVMSVAGVDTTKTRVGYSSTGPGSSGSTQTGHLRIYTFPGFRCVCC